jgi:hypothetical protein
MLSSHKLSHRRSTWKCGHSRFTKRQIRRAALLWPKIEIIFNSLHNRAKDRRRWWQRKGDRRP